MTVRTAHKGDVQHVRNSNIIGVASAAVDQSLDVGARHAFADQSFITVTVRGRHVPDLFFMVSSTASIIAW